MPSAALYRARRVDLAIDELAGVGFAVMPDFVTPFTLAALRGEALRRDEAGELAPASIGHGAGRVEHAAIRGDRISWLDEPSASIAELELGALLEVLRLAINQRLFLGLMRYDGHYAIYPTGAVYARHVDRFRDDDLRVLSCVLYLNDAWLPIEGGALRLHLAGGRTHDVIPLGGTLVAFLSDQFPHEVLAATRPRIALTGWFRRR